jgi:hypothetical protein
MKRIVSTLCGTVLATALLASCVRSQVLPETKTIMPGAGMPVLKTELLATPVRSARAWSTALAPNMRGGWNFITQLYEYKSGLPSEYVVLDLQNGKYSIMGRPAGQITNSNYQASNQIRAANDRIFFSEYSASGSKNDNTVTYYDPKDEKVKVLGQVIPDGSGDDFIYRWQMGADGMLYGSTQAKFGSLPSVVRINPETLEYKVLGKVGKDRKTYSYGYYLEIDPTPSPGAPRGWVYVAVGQEPWELSALNIATGESKVLSTRADAGFISFDLRHEGIVAKLITGLHRADAKTDVYWLADGRMFPYDPQYDPAKLPFKPRDVTPKSGPISDAPEVDTTQLNADADGIGRVFWRPAGSKDEKAWKETRFKVDNTAPIKIESLIALPDGSLLGNAVQYHGFFRYYPKTKTTQFFGEHGPSRGPRVVVDGKVYISGYPSSVLYIYDPTKPWTSNRRLENLLAKDPKAVTESLNPANAGIFRTFTDTHYAEYLLPSKNGRLYFGGRRERTGTGGGVGWYDPATKTFGGHHNNLSFLTPRGMVVLDGLQRVVYSGELQDDPAKPGQKPAEAQLVVYDMDLKELERLTVKPGLTNTGALFPAADPHQLIGVIKGDKFIYRYDLAQKKLSDWIALPANIDTVTRRASDGSLWIVAGSVLWRLDPATMKIIAAGKLQQAPDIMTWNDNQLYVTEGANLYRVNFP